MQNKNFKISVSSFSLKDNPALLMPWMVYSIFFLGANTVLYPVYASEHIALNDTATGPGNIVTALIYICR